VTIEGAILARLKAITAVTDIVGSGANARIYAEHLPQRPVLEAITFKLINTDRIRASGADPGIVISVWQIDAWATTYKAARDLGDAIRGNGAASALSRWSGTLDSTAVQDVFLENELPLSEPGVGEEDMLYRNTQDYEIHYKE